MSIIAATNSLIHAALHDDDGLRSYSDDGLYATRLSLLSALT